MTTYFRCKSCLSRAISSIHQTTNILVMIKFYSIKACDLVNTQNFPKKNFSYLGQALINVIRPFLSKTDYNVAR